MKKLIALVLTVAMLVTCFAFSASADTAAPSVTLTGPDTINAGADIVVRVNVNDTEAGVIGGVQGTITVTGATVSSVTVYDQLAVWNNATGSENTIYSETDGVINFAAVNNLEGAASAAWFELNLKADQAGNVKVALSDVKAADKSAAPLDIATGAAYEVAIYNASVAALNKVGVLERVDPDEQGIVVNASIDVTGDVKASDIVEYGVLFYPTSLLAEEGAELVLENSKAIKANIVAGDDKFEQYLNDGEFNAVLHFNFETPGNAAKFLGTKVSSRVYYVTNDKKVYYSSNTEDKYIKNGIAEKAALTTVLAYADNIAEEDNKSSVPYGDYIEYKKTMNTSYTENNLWLTSRCKVLTYAVENAIAAKLAAQ